MNWKRMACGGRRNDSAVWIAVMAVSISTSSASHGNHLGRPWWWVGLAAGIVVGAVIAGVVRWRRGGC